MSDVRTPPLNVGVYGAARAGKTRFLFQLLDGWQRAGRLVDPSSHVLRYLEQVRAQLDPDGNVPPTADLGELRALMLKEGLAVRVRRAAGLPPWELTLRDLRGEWLADGVRRLNREPGSAREGGVPADVRAVIPDQVRRCNAFLFFFDPSAFLDPNQRANFHEREWQHAAEFVRFTLANRGNRLMPVVFALTHLDQWEGRPEVRAEADAWAARVNRTLRDLYQEALDGHYPPQLVARDFTTAEVASTRLENVEPVIERISRLAEVAADFDRTPPAVRAVGRLAGLLAGTAAVAALLLLAVWLIGASRRQAEVPERAAELERALTAGASTAAEAAAVNAPLVWLDRRRHELRTDPREQASPGPELRTADAAVARAGTALRERADVLEREPSEAGLALLGAMLAGIGEGEAGSDLRAAQAAWWRAARRAVATGAAALLDGKQRLPDLIDELTRRQTALAAVTIAAPDGARARLIDEIDRCLALLEMLRRDGSYPARMRVLSGRVKADNAAKREDRQVRFIAPADASRAIGLQVRSEKDGWLELEVPAVDVDVRPGLTAGPPGSVRVQAYNPEKREFVTAFEVPVSPLAGPSLAALGMSLVPRPPAKVEVPVRQGDYEIKLEFAGFPDVPALLLDAAELAAKGGGA